MIAFDNTAIAFSSKSNADLNRSYWLFKIVGNPSIVKLGQVFTNLALNLHIPIKWAIKPTIFKQFCGGENIIDCAKTIEQLGQFNIGTILDYSVEGKHEEKDFDATTQEIIATIIRAKNDKNIPFSVFKVTGISRFALLEKVNNKDSLSQQEQEEFNHVKKRVKDICQTAHEHKVPVFIDAEESWIQDAIDNLANEMMALYNKEQAIVYNTYQLYRKDRLAYLQKSIEDAEANNYFLGAKLVRGAYMEKERERAKEKAYASPINESKTDTDKMYNDALTLCVERISKVAFCAGSHNEESALVLVNLMKQHHIENNNQHIYFSQLLGMSDHISYNLASEGYNVAKYVPYGPIKEVMPYLIRRAQENTSVKGQTSRELSLIIKEKKRRKA